MMAIKLDVRRAMLIGNIHEINFMRDQTYLVFDFLLDTGRDQYHNSVGRSLGARIKLTYPGISDDDAEALVKAEIVAMWNRGELISTREYIKDIGYDPRMLEFAAREGARRAAVLTAEKAAQRDYHDRWKGLMLLPPA